MAARKTQRPRIMVVANTSWYLWNFRLSLMLQLQKRGMDVIAVAPADEYSQRFADHGLRFAPLALNRRGKNPLAEMKSVASLYRLFRRERPQIILTYTPKANIYASFAARLLGIPVVNNVAGLGYAFVRKGLLPRIVKMLYKVAFSRSLKVFFQNNEDMDFFVEQGLVPPQCAERLPGSGVDTERFAPREKERGPFTFLLVARLLWDKGIGEFVQAARAIRKSYPGAVFQLLGPLDDGNPSAISIKQIEQWQAEGLIDYKGCTDSVADYLAEADCVVLPSAYREGVPRALLEAASMAKPVITTDAPGCRDVVEDGVSGFLCAVRDAESLAQKMRALLAFSDNERLRMGEQGRVRMIRHFSEGIILNKYLDVVNATLDLAPVAVAPAGLSAPALVAKGDRVRIAAGAAAGVADRGLRVDSAA